MIAKRLFDLTFSFVGLVLLLPLFLFLAVLIKRDSPGKVFFRQTRVGRNGELFRIHKFRTMNERPSTGGIQLTVGDDPRITKTGAWLRKYKVDELPQLIDVLRGKMSLVGPRPEVPEYVEHYPQQARELVLSVRPGITDDTSIMYLDENEVLAGSDDPERDYIEKILPVKLGHYQEYVQSRTLAGDILILLRTMVAIFR